MHHIALYILFNLLVFIFIQYRINTFYSIFFSLNTFSFLLIDIDSNVSISVLFSLVLTKITIYTAANKVNAGYCQDGLGSCAQCDGRCKVKHGPTGQGSCDTRNQLCTCYYTCGPPPNPPQPKQCYGGTGMCSNACNQSCAQKYPGGSGFCESIGNTRLCKCQYPC